MYFSVFSCFFFPSLIRAIQDLSINIACCRESGAIYLRPSWLTTEKYDAFAWRSRPDVCRLMMMMIPTCFFCIVITTKKVTSCYKLYDVVLKIFHDISLGYSKIRCFADLLLQTRMHSSHSSSLVFGARALNPQPFDMAIGNGKSQFTIGQLQKIWRARHCERALFFLSFHTSF